MNKYKTIKAGGSRYYIYRTWSTFDIRSKKYVSLLEGGNCIMNVKIREIDFNSVNVTLSWCSRDVFGCICEACGFEQQIFLIWSNDIKCSVHRPLRNI